MRQVGEDTGGKGKAAHAFLLDPDGTDLHEAVSTAFGDHLGEQAVDGDRIGRRVRRFQPGLSDIIGDGRKQTAVVAQVHEQVVQQGDRRGLSVGPGDADEGQLPGRMAEEGIGGEGDGFPAVFYPDGGDRDPLGNRFADDGRRPFFKSGGDIGVAVAFKALHGDKERPRCHEAGITADVGDFRVRFSYLLKDGQRLYDVFQFHFSVSVKVSPSFRLLPASGLCAATWPAPL